MINDLPCIKDKCLLIPICKSKKMIRCDTLYLLIDKLYKDMFIKPSSYSELILVIEELFPNTINVQDNDSNRSHILYNNFSKELKKHDY